MLKNNLVRKLFIAGQKMFRGKLEKVSGAHLENIRILSTIQLVNNHNLQLSNTILTNVGFGEQQ